MVLNIVMMIMIVHNDDKYGGKNTPITTIQMTKGLQARQHVDANNAGSSYAVTFGEFQDEELWVDCGTCPLATGARQLR